MYCMHILLDHHQDLYDKYDALHQVAFTYTAQQDNPITNTFPRISCLINSWLKQMSVTF